MTGNETTTDTRHQRIPLLFSSSSNIQRPWKIELQVLSRKYSKLNNGIPSPLSQKGQIELDDLPNDQWRKQPVTGGKIKRNNKKIIISKWQEKIGHHAGRTAKERKRKREDLISDPWNTEGGRRVSLSRCCSHVGVTLCKPIDCHHILFDRCELWASTPPPGSFTFPSANDP
jgi:hypothetical protein